ncbi:MAG: hypothetical protein AAGA66_03020 [Bacteroidota bacterium]
MAHLLPHQSPSINGFTMMKKFLLVGDYNEGTGFHRVVRHIKNAIIPHFELHHVGIGYHGEVFTDEDGTVIYPETSATGGEMGHKHISRLIDELEPDVFFIIYDIVFIRFLLQALRHKKRTILTGAYLALDGEITKRRKMIAPLKALDFCVFYTDYAHHQIQNLLREQPSLLSRPVDFSVIPHGVDTSLFYPLANDNHQKRLRARTSVFPRLNDPEKAFIVLNANRPTSRKRIDTTLLAFSAFAKGKSSDEVKLYLHQTFHHGVLHSATRRLIEKLELEPYLLEGPLDAQHPIVDNEQLNLIYNACDVGINTCMGEGWGMVSCEHGATRSAQLLPRHTSFPEIWNDAAAWVTHVGEVEVGYTSHRMYQLDPSQVAHRLDVLYHNRDIREAYADRAYETMRQKQYDWTHIEKRWEALFLQYSKRHRRASPAEAFITSSN